MPTDEDGPFIGEIMLQGFGYAPRDWALCDGQVIAFSQNGALGSLLGSAFGGDGRTNFALPDLRGRVPKHVGTGAGLSPVKRGQQGGAEMHTLTLSELPSHNHALFAHAGPGNTAEAGNLLATDSSGVDMIWRRYSASNLVATSPESIGKTGEGKAFSIRNPYLGVCYSISLVGVFPPRS